MEGSTTFWSVRTVLTFWPDGQLPPISKKQLTRATVPMLNASGYSPPDEDVASAHSTSVGLLSMLTESTADPSSVPAFSCSSLTRTLVARKKTAGA